VKLHSQVQHLFACDITSTYREDMYASFISIVSISRSFVRCISLIATVLHIHSWRLLKISYTTHCGILPVSLIHFKDLFSCIFRLIVNTHSGSTWTLFAISRNRCSTSWNPCFLLRQRH